ncbi:arylsulfatase I-like [Pomacea canaliculata]|uniref:arylsulfatase I-like n=1 Tax=Pomacea canaliculata TaxID=400727 RepID=UPI000D733794|nr:arylsulfatase I-like [Pomacea canaliculata]
MLKIPQTWLLTAIVFCHVIACQGNTSKQPHIIFILADDLAINDVSFRNPEVRTPTIDRLASEGVLLDYMYAQPSCSMSRAALLTGRYPHTMGIGKVFVNQDNRSIPVDIKLLPQYLKDQGYKTHMIGKWHGGMCDRIMTPTRRGFDTFSGCLYGNNEHYLDFLDAPFDFWSNETLDHSVAGEYDTEVLTQRTVDVIVNHKENGLQQPLFIYLAYKAVHSPLQAPDIYKQRCQHIQDTLLQERCAMLVAVDDGVKNITDTLEREGYLDEPLLLIFMSDNGGATPYG